MHRIHYAYIAHVHKYNGILMQRVYYAYTKKVHKSYGILMLKICCAYAENNQKSFESDWDLEIKDLYKMLKC